MAKKKADKQTIKHKGKDYELVFNLNVMEEIQEEYGSVEAWGELLESTDEPKAKDVKFGFTEMLNEGIDIYNEEHEDKRDFLTPKQVGRILSEIGLEEVAKKLRQTVVDNTKSDEKN